MADGAKTQILLLIKLMLMNMAYICSLVSFLTLNLKIKQLTRSV